MEYSFFVQEKKHFFWKISGVDKKEMQTPLTEGTVGGSGWVPVNLSNFYNRLPTVEIFKQQFDGIPFEELPIVHVKASRNNTLITVTDHKVHATQSSLFIFVKFY